MIRVLIDAGADLAATDIEGATPLHTAANNGRVGATRVLLRAGANKEAKDEVRT